MYIYKYVIVVCCAKGALYGNTDLINEKFMYKILNLFKTKDDFLVFHKFFDDNLYLDTKEKQQINIQLINSK